MNLRDQVLDVEAMAEVLGMSPQSLYTRRSRDPDSLPPAIRLGRRLMWRLATVENWLAELERTQNHTPQLHGKSRGVAK